jgi:Tol biopolymer transport system component
MSPQAIAHYRIVSKLGEGGMGAVYRATDTKLNRDVAIKILPPAFAEDATRMQRFEREAQLLAALNHPNIAAIYGVEQGAIVMELVEGAEPAGPLPVATVMDYARQIAAGLEAAHEKGIVHRDLKPANIKVTPEGVVKLLDFGLAKAQEEVTAAAAAVSPTISPTLSLAMTQAGMILGTAAYMSPEQARGKPVDKRADIWAFGVILFELLTGRHPYGTGETITDTLAHIVLKDPDLASLPSGTPPRLRRMIERCLRKDARMRLRDIGEARILLDTPEETAAVAPAPRRQSWLPWAVAGLAVAVAAGMTARAWMQPAAEPSPGAAHFVVPMPPGTALPLASAATQWAPSPDGKLLAMVANDAGNVPSLWVRPLNTTVAYHIDKTEGAQLPFWSPEGRFIAFFQDNKLKRVPASGGAVQTICELARSATLTTAGNGGAWGPDGTIVFAESGKPLQRVAASGGIPTPAIVLENDDRMQAFPQFLPDGRHILYLVRGEKASHSVYVQELGSAKRVRLIDTPTRAVFSPPDYLLYMREGTLVAQRMDPNSFRLTREATPLAEDVVANNANGRSTFAVSSNGVLVYRTGRRGGEKQLSWRDRTGKVLATVGKPAALNSLSLSPDEKSLAAILGTEQGYDVWTMNLSTGVLTPMSNEGRLTSRIAPAWSRDSRRLAVSRYDGRILEIDTASGKTTPIMDRGEGFVYDWLPDGRSLLCADDAGTRLSLLTLGDRPVVTPLLTTAFAQTMYQVSPDGKHVAYTSSEAGTQEIYVASFPSFSEKRRVSTASGNYPVWAKGGRELFFRADDGTVMAVEFRGGSTIQATTPRPLFKFGAGAVGNRFAATADGERFLVGELVQQDQIDRPEFHVVLNWQAEIDRR